MNASDSRPAHANTAERRTILDAIPAIAWCKLPDGSNEFVNQRWQDYTGIHALKQAEQKLREDERALRRITDTIPQNIVVLDPDGIPIYANRATLDYTGLALADVVSSDFRARVFHPEDLERVRDQRQAALAAGVPFEFELRALSKEGQYRWFLTRYKPFHDEQGRVVSWYATRPDIDARKQAPARTRNANAAMREEIVRSSRFEELVR